MAKAWESSAEDGAEEGGDGEEGRAAGSETGPDLELDDAIGDGAEAGFVVRDGGFDGSEAAGGKLVVVHLFDAKAGDFGAQKVDSVRETLGDDVGIIGIHLGEPGFWEKEGTSPISWMSSSMAIWRAASKDWRRSMGESEGGGIGGGGGRMPEEPTRGQTSVEGGKKRRVIGVDILSRWVGIIG